MTMGQAALFGTAVGFVIVTSALCAIATSHGVDFGAALGFGAFVGAFGGGGFGCMMGSVLHVVRQEAREDGA